MQVVDVTEMEMLKLALARKKPKKLQAMIERFVMEDDRNLVEIVPDPGEYKDAGACYASLWKAVQRSGYRITVRLIKGHIFLLKEEGK